MRIHDVIKPTEVTKVGAVEGAKGVQGSKSVSRTETAGEVLHVQVSERAHELSAKNVARLEELKASIKNGSFKVDADKIATKLVGDDE